MRELNSDEIDLVAGGATHRPIPSPGSPGILSGNVVRLFADAANGASKATLISDLRVIQGVTFLLPTNGSGFNVFG
jgi:hypothetical protein